MLIGLQDFLQESGTSLGCCSQEKGIQGSAKLGLRGADTKQLHRHKLLSTAVHRAGYVVSAQEADYLLFPLDVVELG